jgi:hypothetical protein
MTLTLLTYEQVEAYFSEVAPEDVPPEFIDRVAVKTRTGELMLSGEDFHKLIKQDKASGTCNVLEARILIKVDRARRKAHEITTEIMSKINTNQQGDND